jgi:hypothetical protein
MTMKKWKIIAAMTGIFLAGAVTGAVLATRVIQKVAERNLSPERWPAALVETYRRKLDLTPEQVEHMRPVVEQAREEWRRTMAGTVMGYGSIVQRLDRELKPLLTPEQLVKHTEIREEWQRRFREKFRANPGSE